MGPVRIQRKRTRGWRMPENAVYVGRPTKWGNPFTVGQTTPSCTPQGKVPKMVTPKDLTEVVDAYCDHINASIKTGKISSDELDELRGKDLACFCPLDKPCHADVLLKLANKENKNDQS